MFKILKNKRAQTISSEYVLVLFLVIGSITAMTMYFKRVVQAQIRDAGNYAVTEVKARTQGYYTGNVYYKYEPYYTRTDSNIVRRADIETRLEEGGATGIFHKVIDETTAVWTASQTAAPKDYGLTTPGGE